jgi:hypothetical protein
MLFAFKEKPHKGARQNAATQAAAEWKPPNPALASYMKWNVANKEKWKRGKFTFPPCSSTVSWTTSLSISMERQKPQTQNLRPMSKPWATITNA